MTSDHELLQRYAKAGSEEAFAELVRRYVDLVYSAALRQVNGDAHLAQDVAQTVFTNLARQAGSLFRCQSLTGWLYTNTHFTAAKIVRGEHRRRNREEAFMREPVHEPVPEQDWEKLRPALDSIMHELKEADREAVLLRYFENRPYAEVAEKLRLNENAARMRVDRAVEKLRGLFAKRDITTGAALASVISANAVQTAPGTLAATLTTASLSGAGAGGFTLFKMMNSLNLKICAGALVAAGGIVLIASRNLHATTGTLNAAPGQQIAEVKSAGDELSSNPASTAGSQSLGDDSSIQSRKASADSHQPGSAKNLIPLVEQTATNAVAETNKLVVTLKIKFVALPEDGLQALRPAWFSPDGGCGTITADQLNYVNGAIKKGGRYSTSESEITTFNGRQAIIGARNPVPNGGADSSIDTMFGVTPCFAPDSSIVRLSVMMRVGKIEGESSTRTNDVTVTSGQTAVLQTQIQSSELSTGSSNVTDERIEFLVFVTPEIGITNQDNLAAMAMAQASLDAGRKKMNESRQVALALIMFASDNQGQYPASIEQASRYAKDGFMNQIETNFDLVYSGLTTNITNPSQTIVLREKQAWQVTVGHWCKVYAFADGHSEIHSEPNNNFDDFEKDRIIAQSSNQ